MPAVSERNIDIDGVLINIYFFCKAVGLPKPNGMENPIPYMQDYVNTHNLNWTDISTKVKIYRDAYKDRRRESHKKKIVEQKKDQQDFFAASNGKAIAKTRCCLRCDASFFSKFGNRSCDKCNYIVNHYLGDEGVFL